MRIKTNGDIQELAEDRISIAGLLKQNAVELPEMVTVQLNGRFVARDIYDSTMIKEGDEVDFLYLMGGGQSG
jgi:sulfur carrier protein